MEFPASTDTVPPMPLTPIQAASDALSRAEAAIKHAQTKGLPKDLSEDLARTAVVVAVGALDTYLHSAVLRKATPWKPSSGLAKLELSLDTVCDLVKEVVAARSKNSGSRPWVSVKECLQQRMRKVTFQSPRQVEDALLMVGVRNGWAKVSKTRKVSAPKLKQRLDALVYRRNRIVHESDLQRAERPRKVAREDVDLKRVARDVAWMRQLIVAIDQVI